MCQSNSISISSMSFINTFIEIGRSRRNSGSSFIGIVLIIIIFLIVMKLLYVII